MSSTLIGPTIFRNDMENRGFEITLEIYDPNNPFSKEMEQDPAFKACVERIRKEIDDQIHQDILDGKL